MAHRTPVESRNTPHRGARSPLPVDHGTGTDTGIARSDQIPCFFRIASMSLKSSPADWPACGFAVTAREGADAAGATALGSAPPAVS